MPSHVNEFIAEIKKDSLLGSQIVYHKIIPAADASYGSNRLPWPAAITNLLEAKGIRLYSHQTIATDHIRAGHSIVASTPTASGKSLIYNLPVLEQHLRDTEATALYLFPLKALAQDQATSFRALTANWPRDARPSIAIYDGDTPEAERKEIRANPPTALITNPEMLHLAILPWHKNWSTFLANLGLIIVDEAHTYRGLFGCHMAQVFRRLNRIIARYGANPAYVFCSATVANPVELATSLSGQAREPVLIDKSGAPAGKRNFLLIEPDLANSTCAIDILKRALSHGLRTIVYCQSRRMTELISLWAGSEEGEWSGKIAAYRAGYLPEERRKIEKRLASGEIQAVVSTSALELGIDIGGLDVCILAGYPGTISQTWQRAGRVGRAGQESAVILIAGENALDQYFTHNPEELFSRPPENAPINPYNEIILKKHLECAAAELPLNIREPLLLDERIRRAAARMVEEHILARTADQMQWVALDAKPHRKLELRGTGQSYNLVATDGRLIGVIDGYRSWKEAHPGAVYLHGGKTYVAQEIDTAERKIILGREEAAYYTKARVKKETAILGETGRISFGRSAVFKGCLRIVEQVIGYERRATSGNDLINIVPLDTPPHVYETNGIWLLVPDTIRNGLEEEFIHFMGSIHALEHALIGMMPLMVLADRNDFGGLSVPLHPQLGHSAVFLYDGLPGGAGLCEPVFHNPREILEATLQGISTCECEDGCPSCIQSPKCGAGNRPLSKQGAIRLLEELLLNGTEGAELCQKIIIPPASEGMGAPKPIPVVLRNRVIPGRADTEKESPSEGGSEQATPEKAGETCAPLILPYMVLDVETRRSAAEVGGWDKAEQMGVSIAVVYDSSEDKFFRYKEEELGELWERLKQAKVVIGFNSLKFDYKVLKPFCGDLAQLPSLDLLQRIYKKVHFRISLDNLCRSTLNSQKSASGLQALKWWKQGNLEKLAEYCQKDVDLTRQLYLFGRQNGFVLYTNKAGMKVRIPADFEFSNSEFC